MNTMQPIPLLTLLVGLSGSGKSTRALLLQQKNPNTRIVGRDKLRELFFGYTEETVTQYYQHPDLLEREDDITRYQHHLVRELLRDGHSVIIDDTNCRRELIDKWLREYHRYSIQVDIVDTSVDICIQRCKARNRQVPESIIQRQFIEFTKVKLKYTSHVYPPTVFEPYTPDTTKPPVVICDLDGTLCTSEHRSMYTSTDEEILNDKLVEPVAQVLLGLWKRGIGTIFMSGRSEKYRDITSRWLQEKLDLHLPPYLFMLQEGDYQRDYQRDDVIKYELFQRHVAPEYQVVAAVDDRHQVMDMWTDIGLFVFNVNQTRTHF